MVHSFPTVRLKRVISILYILFYMRAGGTSRGLPRNGIGAGRLQGGCRYILYWRGIYAGMRLRALHRVREASKRRPARLGELLG